MANEILKKPDYPKVAQDLIESSGSIYPDSHRGKVQWHAIWVDHAGRTIIKVLGPVSELGGHINSRNVRGKTTKEIVSWGLPPRKVRKLAADEFREYKIAYKANLEQKAEATEEQIAELAESADFPREVVERIITEICDRITTEDIVDARFHSEPGLYLFLERAGLSTRIGDHIMQSKDYFSVDPEIVDKICVEFNYSIQDFIDSSLAWASKSGAWEDRVGKPDPWPYGYQIPVPTHDDII